MLTELLKSYRASILNRIDEVATTADTKFTATFKVSQRQNFFIIVGRPAATRISIYLLTLNLKQKLLEHCLGLVNDTDYTKTTEDSENHRRHTNIAFTCFRPLKATTR